jgi:hypothetical protein
MLEHYRAQVRAYLDITDAERGLIVLATTGRVISVERARASGVVSLATTLDDRAGAGACIVTSQLGEP